jgi:hypothetical protein
VPIRDAYHEEADISHPSGFKTKKVYMEYGSLLPDEIAAIRKS